MAENGNVPMSRTRRPRKQVIAFRQKPFKPKIKVETKVESREAAVAVNMAAALCSEALFGCSAQQEVA